MIQELPQGWVEVKVGTVLNLINGFAFKPSQWGKTGLPIIRIQNLNNSDAPFNFCDGQIPEKVRVRRGDLLFAWSGTPGTSFGSHIWNGRESWLNQHIFRVEFDPNLFHKIFLKHAINQNLERYIAQAHGGAGLAHITKGMFEAALLKLPPFAEQQRIVAKLEVLLGKVDACRKRLEKIPVILKRFRQSVLAAAISGRLTADWREDRVISEGDREFFERVREQRLRLCKTSTETQRIEHSFSLASAQESLESDNWLPLKAELVCDFITKGTTPKEIESGTHGDIPFLKVYNIISNKIDFSSKPQFVSRKTHEGVLRRSVVYPGDVLMNIVGPPLAKVAVVPLEYSEWNINQAIAIFRPIRSVDSGFLRISLLGSKSLQEIIAQTRGIVGQSNLSLEQCRNLDVEVPPLPEQHEIVRRVEALFALADQIETRYAKAKTHVDRLTQSILAKAFRGDLVPQYPNDEPASALLERIQFQRQEEGVARKQPRRKDVMAGGMAGIR